MRLAQLVLGIVIFLAALMLLVEILVLSGTPPRIDPKLEAAVAQWKTDLDGIEFRNNFHAISEIKVAKLESRYTGLRKNSTGSILVSETQLKAGPYSTLGTLYHELGHWVFNLEHGSCALMRSEVWTEEEYAANWDEWLIEYRQACEKNNFNLSIINLLRSKDGK